MSTTIAPIEPEAATGQAAELLEQANARRRRAEADIAVARAAGVTDEEIGEVVANLALNTLTNYFNVLANVRNDWPALRL